jgi:hypothetical protein
MTSKDIQDEDDYSDNNKIDDFGFWVIGLLLVVPWLVGIGIIFCWIINKA